MASSQFVGVGASIPKPERQQALEIEKMTSPTRALKNSGSLPVRNEIASAKSSSLMWRLGLTLVFVLIFSISLSALLTYFNYESRHRELISSRLQVMLDEVRLGVDYGTSLGLPLVSLSETGDQLQALVAADSGLEKAAVYSARKQVLFQAGAGDLDQLLPDAWFQATSGSPLFFRETDAYLLVAEPLFNTFNVQSGVVVMAYSRAAYQAKNASLLQQQLWQSGLVVLTSALLGLGLLGLKIRRLRQQILWLGNRLDQQLKGKASSKVEQTTSHFQLPEGLEARFKLLHDCVDEVQVLSSMPKNSALDKSSGNS